MATTPGNDLLPERSKMLDDLIMGASKSLLYCPKTELTLLVPKDKQQ